MKRHNVEVMNRTIGTHTDYDVHDFPNEVYYEFIPAKEVKLLEGTLEVDYLNGFFRYYDDDGNLTNSFDMIEILRDIPYQQPDDE